MAIKRHITHIKMSGDTTPLARQLMYGELGVNYGKDHEKLYIKNSEDEIIPIETESQSHEYVDNKVISGNSLGVKVEDNNGNTSSPKLGNAPIKITHTAAGNVVQTISGSSGTVLVEGSSFNIPTVSIDQFGHVKSGSTTSVKISDTFRYITGVTNTDEIALAVDGDRKLSATHSGHTDGGTASGTNGTFTLVYNKDNNTGITFNLPTVTYNKYGHVISSGTTSVTLKLQQASESAWGDVKLVQTTGSSTELVMSQSAITSAIQQSFIENSALRYKGTVSSYNEFQTKGADHKVGDLYKVSATFVIPGTNPEVKVEPGDMLIANTSGTTFNLSHWDVIQSNINTDLYALKTTKVIAGDELSGGGSLSGDVTINHVTKFTGTGKTNPNTAQTYALNGATGFNVPVISYNEYGHITATTTTTVRVTAATATQSSDGLMSSTDKTTLDHLASAATNVSVSDLNPNGDKNLASITVDGTTTYIKSGPEKVNDEVAISASTPTGETVELWVDTTTSPTANTYTASQVDGLLTHKQNLLTSGVNIKTINYESLLGSGNINIQGGGSVDVVQVTGTSTTAVMSQNAVSTLMQKKLVSGTDIKTLSGQTLLGSGNIEMKTVGGVSIFGTGDIPVGGVVIEQNTGASTTAVMSQNAVSTLMQKKLTAGANISIADDGTISATGGGGGGDYLPLSGGTINGSLRVTGQANFDNSVGASGFTKTNSDDNYVLLGGGGHKPLSEIGNRVYIDGNTLVI